MHKALVVWLTIGAGCTFTGLGRYDIGNCNAGNTPKSLDEDPCRNLDLATVGCLRYQCNAATGRCEQRARDFDRDGNPDVACGGSDCDDRDGLRRSGRAETCDGVDNDCNGIVDDHLVSEIGRRALLSLPQGFRDASLTGASGREILGAAVVDRPEGSCILAFRGAGEALAPPCTFPPQAGVAPRQPVVRPIFAEDMTFGAAFVTASSSCTAGQIAFRSSKGGALDATCIPGGASAPSFLPYPNGKAVVVTYLRRPIGESVRDCADTPAALDIAWIDRPTATSIDPPPRVYAQRLAVANSLSRRPPALVPLGDVVILAAPADGAVGVWALRAPRSDGSGESVVPLMAPQSLGALADARSVGIALDAHEGDQRIALVAEVGCPPAQRLAMVIARVGVPGPIMTVLHVVEALPPSPRAAAPQIAWIESRKEWWVSWLGDESAGSGLWMRRFNASGEPAGEPIAAAPNERIVAALPNAESTGPSAAIDFIDSRAVNEVSIGCR